MHCLRKRGCSIFRPKSLTHVGVAARCHVGLSPEQLGDASGDDGGDVHEVLPTAVMEPYVMVRRTEQLPLFDERFINYGFNKVQWIENLRYLGFEFSVLSQAFAVDIPHSS